MWERVFKRHRDRVAPNNLLVRSYVVGIDGPTHKHPRTWQQRLDACMRWLYANKPIRCVLCRRWILQGHAFNPWWGKLWKRGRGSACSADCYNTVRRAFGADGFTPEVVARFDPPSSATLE